MLQVAANRNDGSLDIPLGSKFTICYRSKRNGRENVARIQPGPEKNHFYAFFEEDDVEFQIKFQNSSNDRSVCFNLRFLDKETGIITRNNSNSKIETLESNGRKFRFIRQAGEEGRKLISTTAADRRLNQNEASDLLSKLEIGVEYSCLPKYPIILNIKGSSNITLEVNRVNSVFDLKLMIASTLGLKSSNQIVNFKGKQLYDNETMDNLGIVKHSVLQLVGSVFPIEVRVLRNKSVSIMASSLDHVGNLKKAIEKEVSVAVKDQYLYFKGDLLENSKILDNLNIAKNSKIFLATRDNHANRFIDCSSHECSLTSLFPVEAVVPNGNAVTVYACTLDTVKEVVMKILDKSQSFIEVDSLDCFLHGKVLENHLTLEAYSVNDKCTINFRMKCSKEEHFCNTEFGQRILISTLTGKSLPIRICSYEMVETLKTKITEEKGIPADQQRLIYGGKQLEDGRSLKCYNICHGSTISLVLRLRGGGCGCSFGSIHTCIYANNKDSDDSEPSSEQKFPDFSEKGAIAFGGISEQRFSDCDFYADYTIRIEPFTVELRLAAIPFPN